MGRLLSSKTLFCRINAVKCQNVYHLYNTRWRRPTCSCSIRSNFKNTKHGSFWSSNKNKSSSSSGSGLSSNSNSDSKSSKGSSKSCTSSKGSKGSSTSSKSTPCPTPTTVNSRC